MALSSVMMLIVIPVFLLVFEVHVRSGHFTLELSSVAPLLFSSILIVGEILMVPKLQALCGLLVELLVLVILLVDFQVHIEEAR